MLALRTENAADPIGVFGDLVSVSGIHTDDDAVLRLDVLECLLKRIVDELRGIRTPARGEDLEHEACLVRLADDAMVVCALATA